MTKPPELKPCPFCGGACEMWNANDGRPAWIACMGRCAVLISKEHKTDAEAIAAWNNRTPDLAVQALVEALKDALDAWGTHCESGDQMQGYWVCDARSALAAFDKTDP